MKKTVFIFIVIHTSFQIAEAQWIRQFEITPFNHLSDIHFIDEKTGWTCGNQGTIIRTTNGGLDWVSQNSGVPGEILDEIFAVDLQVVYCVGYFETILKSTNGGDNWNIIRHSPEQAPSYHGLFFLNKDTGWMSKNQYILRTTDGCQTFDSTFVNISYIYDIYFKNHTDGLFCGEGGSIYKTTNGGTNWSQVYVPVGTESSDFFNLTFVNSNTGYSQGVYNNKIYKTTDFGITWDSIARIQEADDSYCIFFTDENTGWSAGSFGRMFKTTNGGFNWKQENLSQFSQGYLRSLYFVNDTIGWAVGAATKILYTSNGGQTFINPIGNVTPLGFSLKQNFPNPFNSNTIIRFDIHKNNIYQLEVCDVIGRRVEILVNKYFSIGKHELIYDAGDLTSGIYFYTLYGNGYRVTKKFLLIK